MKNSITKHMSIGMLAKQTGVGVETVRFYQRKGILPKPDQSCGIKKYCDDDAKKIIFVKKAQALGFSLASIQELLAISVCSDTTRPQLEQICRKKISEVKDKIDDLVRMQKMLTNFSQACGKNKSDDECNLLNCFENQWNCCKKS